MLTTTKIVLRITALWSLLMGVGMGQFTAPFDERSSYNAPTSYGAPTPYGAPAVQQSSSKAPGFYTIERVCPVCLDPTPPTTPNPDHVDIIDFTKKIGETVYIIGETLSDISEIAIDDNPEVGAEILRKLQEDISQSSRILTEFVERNPGPARARNGRFKRAAKDEGNAALNKAGDTLAGSNKKIDGDKKKLSKKAQAKIDKKHKDGLDKCRADSCRAASKLLADADEGERQ